MCLASAAGTPLPCEVLERERHPFMQAGVLSGRDGFAKSYLLLFKLVSRIHTFPFRLYAISCIMANSCFESLSD